MPITVSARDEGPLVLTVEDPYTFEEWVAAATSVVSRGPGLRILIDRSRSSAPSRDIVERMVNFFERHTAQIKRWRAAIVTGSDAGYGVARMLELSTEARNIDVEIHAFRDHRAAERWLMTGQEC
jgi:hypothetical protein